MSPYIVITRLSTDGFVPKRQPIGKTHHGKIEGMEGVWVFIRGAESRWSVNHRSEEFYKNPDLYLWIGKIPADTKVYNFVGREETAGAIFEYAARQALERGHLVFDHEDAGFFIPAWECHKIYDIDKIRWQYVLPAEEERGED